MHWSATACSGSGQAPAASPLEKPDTGQQQKGRDEHQVLGRNFGRHIDVENLLVEVDPQFLRLAAEDVPGVLSHAQTTWESLYPGYPFRYFFLDEDFNEAVFVIALDEASRDR